MSSAGLMQVCATMRGANLLGVVEEVASQVAPCLHSVCLALTRFGTLRDCLVCKASEVKVHIPSLQGGRLLTQFPVLYHLLLDT